MMNLEFKELDNRINKQELTVIGRIAEDKTAIFLENIINNKIKYFDLEKKDLMVSLKNIKQICRKEMLELNNELDAILIDNINFIEDEKYIIEFYRQLKIIAKELNIAIIASEQLNKDIEIRDDKKLYITDFEKSLYAVTTYSDNIWLINKIIYDDNKISIDLTIAKDKNGKYERVNICLKK